VEWATQPRRQLERKDNVEAIAAAKQHYAKDWRCLMGFERTLQHQKNKAEGRDRNGRFVKKNVARQPDLGNTASGAGRMPEDRMGHEGTFALRVYKGTACRNRGRKGFTRGTGFKIS
jgi:hypothetical protein